MHIKQIDNEAYGLFSNTKIGTSAGGDFIKQTNKTAEEVITPAQYLNQVTYGKPGQSETSVQDIMSEAAGLDAVQMKNEMLWGVNSITEEDAKKIEDDGFSLRDTDIHAVVTETDKIQAKLAQAGVDTSYFGDKLSKEQLEDMGATQAAMNAYADALAGRDMPFTTENRDEFAQTVSMSQAVGALSEGAIKYLLANNMDPTVENIYGANFNGAGAYIAKPTEEILGDEVFTESISTVICAAGLEANKENLDAAQWMAANDIEVTAENLNYYNDLKAVKLPIDPIDLAKKAAITVSEGLRPEKTPVIEGYSMTDKALEALAVIESATDEDLAYVLNEGQAVTIENLKNAHNLIAAGEVSANVQGDFTDKGIEIIKARRNLEEVRLVMTAEANKALLKSGINIDTKPIEKLVEDLKNQENAYYKNLLSDSENPVNSREVAQKAELFSNVLTLAESLKTAPAAAISIEAPSETVQMLAEKSAAAKALVSANDTYETMMTTPRADLGDNIKKAFANVDDILTDLGLETSERNERAVRILSYNRSAINEENILKMKQADMAVQKAFDSLKPATVREMIKEGINPLDMSLDELNKKASEISKAIGADSQTEKYSEYLYKLDMRGELSEQERDSYIGIFRLINQVELGDGAAIGALVNQGQDITMGKLLSAVRSSKKGVMDYKVDDDFGGVNGTIKGKSITEQINAAYQMECFTEIVKTADSPEQFSDLLNSNKWQELTPEQFLSQMKESEPEADKAYYNDMLESFADAAAAEEEVFRMLDAHDVPVTMNNITAMQQMMAGKNEFKRIFNIKPEEMSEHQELMKELQNIKNDILEKLGEETEAPEEYAKALETLYEVAEHCSQTVMYEKGMTALDLRQMQMATKQLFIGTKMAKNEHYRIPVETSDGISVMDVKVVRDSEEKGKVALTMNSPEYGNIAAELKAKDDRVEGYIAVESEAALEMLKNSVEELKAMFDMPVEINVINSGHVDMMRFLENEKGENIPKEDQSPVQTSRLYKIAKNMVKFFK